MNHTKSIKKNSDFRNIYAKGFSTAGRLMVLYSRANGSGNNYLGVTVGKKVGGAVVRNRIKRLIKESYRQCENEINVGYDLVVVARKTAGRLPREGSFLSIETALKALLLKQGLLAK